MRGKKLLLSIFCTATLALLSSCSSTPEPKQISINPTPHSLEIISQQRISLEHGFKLVDSADIFAEDIPYVNGDGTALPLSVQFGEQVASQNGVKPIAEAYSLKITPEGVQIRAFDQRGAYYGVQSLLQLIDSKSLPEVSVNDFPDIPYRGVVEGFYGTPWSHEVRMSLIDFYGDYKLNSYLYGPKDDPYHSSPKWREPYPEKEAQQIKELVEISNKNYVDFVWAIHPGKDIKWTESDYQKLLAKFEGMYDIGVRSFALFFDDIEGIGTRADKQAELLNRLQKEFVVPKGDVKPLIMCPTDYTLLWADPSETGYLSTLGDTLDPSIHIMWTGDAICCDITDGTLEWVNSRINRPTFIWWNYPVTDYVKHIILQGPVYGNTQLTTKDQMAGFVSNPMENGEASKLALYSVADYTWNVEGYEALDSWERGIELLMPEAKEAYRTFAIHSADTETGYRRDESWETTTFTIDDYTQEQYDALYEEFQRIKTAPNTIKTTAENKLLVKELMPWLAQFELLGQRGITTLDLIKLHEQGENSEFWDLYRASTMSDEQLAAYKANRSGTLKLTPFINSARQDLAIDFYSSLSGRPIYATKPIASFANAETELGNLMLDNNSNTYYHSAQAQSAGSWVGVDLGEPTEISHIYIEQGRNNVDDVDYFDSARLEISSDGTTWTTLLDNLKKAYIVEWSGEPVTAQYVRIVRLDDSQRKNWMAVRRFLVNPTASEPSFTTNIAQLQGRPIETIGNSVTMKPVLEVVSVKPGEYFGIDMPLITALAGVEADLGNEAAMVEYSDDGKTWSKQAKSAKHIRYTNRTDKPVSVKINKLSILTASSSDAELSKAIDEDIATAYQITESATFAIPQGAKEVIILSDADQKGSATISIDSNSVPLTVSLLALTLDENATTITISGDVAISEVIFK